MVTVKEYQGDAWTTPHVVFRFQGSSDEASNIKVNIHANPELHNVIVERGVNFYRPKDEIVVEGCPSQRFTITSTLHMLGYEVRQ